jgi:secretion/DNA translocation related TadE-like protein
MNRSVADSQTRGAQPALRGAPVDVGALWRSGRRGRSAGERGGATLVGLALTGFVLLAGLAAVDIGALAVARAAAQTAADMAALAALTPREGPVAPAGGSAETRAAELAGANGAELVSCDCSAVQAVVRVRRRQRLVPAGLTLALTASARAVLSQPPATNRATVRAVDHSRAADGSQASPGPGQPRHGRPTCPRTRAPRWRRCCSAVRSWRSGSPSAMCRRSAWRSSGSGRADCCWGGSRASVWPGARSPVSGCRWWAWPSSSPDARSTPTP